MSQLFQNHIRKSNKLVVKNLWYDCGQSLIHKDVMYCRL